MTAPSRPCGPVASSRLPPASPAKVRVVADAVVQGPSAGDAGGSLEEATGPQGREGAVMAANLDLFRAARSEVLVVSPYFVPMPRMIDALTHANREGARVSVMTNSLATTDEPLVHHGYARYRGALLQMGAALYELMPASEPHPAWSGTEGARGSLGRLHAKVAVVDQRSLYIGSMNMDRRSAHCNTEVGLIIDSAELAHDVTRLLQREQAPRSYRVRWAAAEQRVEWVQNQPGGARVFTSEPDSTWNSHLTTRALGLLVNEEML